MSVRAVSTLMLRLFGYCKLPTPPPHTRLDLHRVPTYLPRSPANPQRPGLHGRVRINLGHGAALVVVLAYGPLNCYNYDRRGGCYYDSGQSYPDWEGCVQARSVLYSPQTL